MKKVRPALPILNGKCMQVKMERILPAAATPPHPHRTAMVSDHPLKCKAHISLLIHNCVLYSFALVGRSEIYVQYLIVR
jgi:hypothetical protein